MSALVMLSAALAFGACDEDPDYMHCPLSNSILEVCEAEAEGAAIFTCVVEQHPYCAQAICASWMGSEPFCTQACAGDGNCQGGATCESYLDLKFCVPPKAKTSEPAPS